MHNMSFIGLVFQGESKLKSFEVWLQPANESIKYKRNEPSPKYEIT